MKKKVVLVLIKSSLIAFCFAQPDTSARKTNTYQFHQVIPDSTRRSFSFISLSDAEKILQQPAHLKDSVWKFEGQIWKYKCIYLANFKDTLAGKTGRIFFEFEHYKKTFEAQRFYDLTKTENGKNYTVINLSQMGDEAFLVKDIFNSPFIMIRKDKKIFKLRVYNVTSAASLDELQAVAKKIVSPTYHATEN